MSGPDSQAVLVRGRSMEPCLFEGDLVQLTPIPGTEARRGKLYAFVDPGDGITVSHRCVGEFGDFLEFRGDRQPHSEKVPRTASLFRVERLLERRFEPEPRHIVFGLLKQIDEPSLLDFPRHATLHWPWEKCFTFARQHRVLTAFAWCLKSSGLWAEAPPAIRSILQLDLYQAALRAEQISQVCEEISRLLPEGRFLKGAALRSSLYPSPELRTMADIDYLVSEKRFNAGLEILSSNGFSLSDEWRESAGFFHEAALVHKQTGLEVELHKAIFQKHRYRFSSESFLRNEDPLEELLYLSSHALTHFGAHGLGYWEIYRFLKTGKAELALAAERAKDRQCSLAFAFALRVIKSWWNEDFEARAEEPLSLRQKVCLNLAAFFYLDAVHVPMPSFRKRLLMALLADDLGALARMILDPARLRMTYLSKV